MAETAISPAACTVTEMFGSFAVGECGKPAADTITSVCPEGHEERTPMCAEHKSLILDSRVPLRCAACEEVGNRNHLEVTR
jgi:hypothetical protein